MSKTPVSRDKIPWFPSIEKVKCTACLACLDFCPHGVFARDEGKTTVRVDRPYECVVGCSNCLGVCPASAISFPDLEEIMDLIRTLRNQNGR